MLLSLTSRVNCYDNLNPSKYHSAQLTSLAGSCRLTFVVAFGYFTPRFWQVDGDLQMVLCHSNECRLISGGHSEVDGDTRTLPAGIKFVSLCLYCEGVEDQRYLPFAP